jgi:two-component system, cell cycle response regulator CtrA
VTAPRDAVIEKLEDENEELRGRIQQLEDELAWTGVVFPIEWALTGRESQVLCSLMGREVCTKAYVHTMLYSTDPDGGAEIMIVNVFICKMRKKLTPYGIKIETRWGIGYSLSQESRTSLKGYVHAKAA